MRGGMKLAWELGLTIVPHVDNGDSGVTRRGLGQNQLGEGRCRHTLQCADSRHGAGQNTETPEQVHEGNWQVERRSA